MEAQSQENYSNIENPEAKKPKTIEEIFAEKRLKWKTDIGDTIEKMKSLDTLFIGQTQAYSQRHMCVDEIHFLMDIFNKVSEKIKTEKFNLRKAISSNDRYSKDINEEIDAKTSTIKKQADIIDSQINFFKETIKTLDQMLYGIKYRLDYENNWNRMS